jgi:hypothetical protein
LRVRLTQIDGKLRSLALMKLAHYHRAHGDVVHFTRHIERRRGGTDLRSHLRLGDLQPQRRSRATVKAVPPSTHDISDHRTVEQLLGVDGYEHYDYSIYPGLTASIGLFV